MSREVILGEKGLVKGAKKGFVIADCSTVSPLESSRIAQELAGAGASNFWMLPVPAPKPVPKEAR